ncbi:MAG: autotransporter outer membrane beta-barrel domain-containing protein, partial [Planctomycetaceae bacterium]|nr:autotransporter outer membrane beta-barrel domain-containing protein [Planctomycetaceae bacterium]
EVTTAGKIEGGGIIGVNIGSTIGISTIQNINNNIFNKTKVTSANTIEGGGIIGVRTTTGFATLENLQNNTFTDTTIDITNGNLEGGGIIGVRADNISNDAFAAIRTIDNLKIYSAKVQNVDKLEGGGIVGVRANAGNAFIEEISAMTFGGDLITTNISANTIEGGGVIGVRSESGNATINSITNSDFYTITIEARDQHIQGGGIISVRSDSLAKIDRISNTQFWWNNVSSAKWIDGGGIIGASGSAKDNNKDPHGGIGLIDNVLMALNTIEAKDGQIMCGLIYSYGAAGGMIIKDSTIISNKFDSKVTGSYGGVSYNAKVYGAITIDTGSSGTEHVVTVTSTAKKQTEATIFYDNAIYETNSIGAVTPDRYNSFYFGTMPYIDGSNTVVNDFAAANAKLIIASEATGMVFLLDPIHASQQNENGKYHTFNMEVGHKNGNESGLLVWAGDNKFEILTNTGNIDTTTRGSLTMFAGSNTTLVDSNSNTTLVNYGELWSKEYEKAKSMTLEAPNYTVELKKGAWLNVEGHNYWDLSLDNNGNDPKVKFNGDLHFNLNNTKKYNDIIAPSNYTNTPNDNALPLLTIKTPDQNEMIDLNGATVHLQDFLDTQPLSSGDRFYLIDATDSNDANDAQQLKFSNADKLANDKDSDGRFVAYARQGLTRGYYFIIDLNGEFRGTGGLENTHYLTARLRSAEPMPAKELVPPAEGRITGITFLNHLVLPNLYNIDPQCDPCGDCDSGSNWVKMPFVNVSGNWYSGDTGNDSRFHVRGSVFQAGLAFQKKNHHGRLFWGVFFDSGCADYNTYNYIAEIKRSPEFRGNGELNATGGGLFVKKYLNNGWHFDGIVRGGNLRNEYYNPDINIHNTNFEMKYNTDSAYFSTELGLNRQWKIGKRRLLDAYGRYAYSYMTSNSLTWNYTTTDGTQMSFSESVHFNAVNSHRTKLGLRYTQKRTSNLSWYLDGGYEYEFDGKADGYAYDVHGHVGDFDGPKLRGGYGIGEIGLTYKKNDRFQLSTSLEGYVGKRTGGNLNFTSSWKW